jgi:hypothetical protein
MRISIEQGHIHRYCILCTCLMILATLMNLYSIRTRRPCICSSTVSTSASTLNQNASKLLAETFYTLKRSFIKSYRQRIRPNRTYCPEVPSTLIGAQPIKYPPINFSLLNISSYHRHVHTGGRSFPTHCIARHKVALIVPYRNRWGILTTFLFHYHHILHRQQLDYRIFVCEQAFDQRFNKGIVMNACFKEILQLEPTTACFVMHDVDLLLMDDRNMYSCPIHPRHLSVSIDKFNFYVPYSELVGGVLGEQILSERSDVELSL